MIAALLDIDIAIPDHTTLSRREGELTILPNARLYGWGLPHRGIAHRGAAKRGETRRRSVRRALYGPGAPGGSPARHGFHAADWAAQQQSRASEPRAAASRIARVASCSDGMGQPFAGGRTQRTAQCQCGSHRAIAWGEPRVKTSVNVERVSGAPLAPGRRIRGLSSQTIPRFAFRYRDGDTLRTSYGLRASPLTRVDCSGLCRRKNLADAPPWPSY